MEKNFWLGMILGLIGGGVICANSYKARRAVLDGQEQIMAMLEKMDEKKQELKSKEESATEFKTAE